MTPHEYTLCIICTCCTSQAAAVRNASALDTINAETRTIASSGDYGQPAAEILFPEQLLTHPRRTRDASAARIFVVPAFLGLSSRGQCGNANGTANVDELGRFLRGSPSRHTARDTPAAASSRPYAVQPQRQEESRRRGSGRAGPTSDTARGALAHASRPGFSGAAPVPRSRQVPTGPQGHRATLRASPSVPPRRRRGCRRVCRSHRPRTQVGGAAHRPLLRGSDARRRAIVHAAAQASQERGLQCEHVQMHMHRCTDAQMHMCTCTHGTRTAHARHVQTCQTTPSA